MRFVRDALHMRRAQRLAANVGLVKRHALLVAIVLAFASLADAQTPCQADCQARLDACEATCRARDGAARPMCLEACRVEAQACNGLCATRRR